MAVTRDAQPGLGVQCPARARDTREVRGRTPQPPGVHHGPVFKRMRRGDTVGEQRLSDQTSPRLRKAIRKHRQIKRMGNGYSSKVMWLF